jgi:hypothetical protein
MKAGEHSNFYKDYFLKSDMEITLEFRRPVDPINNRLSGLFGIYCRPNDLKGEGNCLAFGGETSKLVKKDYPFSFQELIAERIQNYNLFSKKTYDINSSTFFCNHPLFTEDQIFQKFPGDLIKIIGNFDSSLVEKVLLSGSDLYLKNYLKQKIKDQIEEENRLYIPEVDSLFLNAQNCGVNPLSFLEILRLLSPDESKTPIFERIVREKITLGELVEENRAVRLP